MDQSFLVYKLLQGRSSENKMSENHFHHLEWELKNIKNVVLEKDTVN